MASPLFDPVALALTGYARTRFRVCAVGSRLRLEPGSLLVSTHRSDADVPVLIATLYPEVYRPGRRAPELHFAVRDDLFLPGFFAGYPPGLPGWARRLLFPLGIGRILEGALPCHPIRSATRMRLVELLREHPTAPLDELLPPELAQEFYRRGLRRSAPAREAVHGRFAELLWRVAGDDELRGQLAEESWRRRAAAAVADFRILVELLRGGAPLLVFPEGRPSPDGSIGPLQPGLAALIRRARPSSLRPLAVAYDPLVPGRRPHAYVGVGEAVEPVADEQAVLALLRRTTPLTAGQLVATGSGEREIEEALRERRPVAPELVDSGRRRARLAEARAAAAGRDLRRLAVEYRSVRA